jgi:phenylacetate-CoA ligase
MPSAGGDRSLARRLAWSAHVALRAPFESRRPFAPPDRLRANQLHRLREAVAHAREHVPFYREELRRLGLGAGDVEGPGDLALLPIVDREMLAADPERFLSRAEPPDRYVELRSGGSTGDPITLRIHPRSLFEQAIYSERHRGGVVSKLAGKRRYREARVADIPSSYAGGHHVSSSFRRLSLIAPSLRFQRRQFSAIEPLEDLVPSLDAYDPDVLASFGSFQEMYLAHLISTGHRARLPRVMVYAGDGMSANARRLARERFGIRTLSIYTATEAFQIGFECERNRGHHLNEDLFPIRVVGPGGEEVPDGEPGEVIVSNLESRGTVLLNYRLNDVAARLGEPCPCGRTLPLLSLVQGRSDDWLEGPDGRRLHSQSVRIFMHDELEVVRYQVVQAEPDRFGAALVTVPGADRERLAARLRGRFREAFGDVELEVTFVDDLPRSAAGKARPVVAMASVGHAARAGTISEQLQREGLKRRAGPR